jgi:4-hydroxy-3-methylbut-2-en-1-yl diphosphate synthase IspG/GcpE
MPLIQIEDTRRGERRKSVVCHVGRVPVGGAHPVVVQSMTNTDTADPAATAEQVSAARGCRQPRSSASP